MGVDLDWWDQSKNVTLVNIRIRCKLTPNCACDKLHAFNRRFQLARMNYRAYNL
jgi:hypothetical protein